MAEAAACTFCNLSDRPEILFDVNRADPEAGISFVPTVGMLMPGYLLATTNTHVTSFAQLEKGRLRDVDRCLTRTEQYLGRIFGSYFRLEHGSDNITHCGSGGCIDHAHQHLVPAASDVGAHIQGQLDWQRLGSFEDLADFRGKPYIYLGRDAEHFAVSDPQLPGQWVRRQIAAVRGIEHWDWGIYNGAQELFTTFCKLGKFPAGRVVWTPSSDGIKHEDRRPGNLSVVLPDLEENNELYFGCLTGPEVGE